MHLKGIMRRTGALVLASAMALLTACNKGGQEQSNNAAQGGVTSEYTYVPEFKDVKLKENADAYMLQMANGNIYYTASEYEGDVQSTVIYVQSMEDQKDLGSMKVEIPSGENIYSYVQMIAVRPDGGVCVVKSVSTMSENEEKADVICCLFDSSYNQIGEVDLKQALNVQDDYYSISKILFDADNRAYVLDGNGVHIFDENMQYQGSVDGNGEYFSFGGTAKDGKVYVGYINYETAEAVLLPVEYSQKAFGEKHTGFVMGANNFGPGVEHDILVSDANDVYDYDLQSNTANKLFAWLDCDIMGSNIKSVMKLDDGRLVAFLDSDEMDQPDSLVYLTKTKSSEVAQKKQITIASLYGDYELKATAIAFNKQNSEYHVNVRSFNNGSWSEEAMESALSNLNNAITAGEGIDLVQVNDLPNYRALANKGAFEDLTSYLEQDGGKDAYLENVLEAGAVNGKQIFVPKYFDLSTYVGKASLVGKESGWTMDELLALAKAHPDSKVFNWSNKDDALDVCLKFTGGEFIDENTGKCSFESEDFKKILEFVHSFPDTYDWSDSEEENTVEELRKEQLLLERVYIYNLGTLQMYPEEFGEDVTFIGYPTADGTPAHEFQFNNASLAISSKAADKEAAWKFLQFYLNNESEMLSSGLPSKKADLEKMMQEKMSPQYMTDENGNVLKDENGQPISTLGSTWNGDWEYNFHISTQEEMDQEYKVIKEARASIGVDAQILEIIKEEAAAYFAGQKSVDDVAGVIQSRVQLYVNENR